MNKNHLILTPIPTVPIFSPPDVTVKSGSSEKLQEIDTKNENTSSSKLIDSTVFKNFPQRRNSAFSIYEPLTPKSQQKQDSSSSDQEGAESQGASKPRRTWKREKKDKREMNRLETKNLNRYFRSKINEMLRDVKENPKSLQEKIKAQQVLEMLNKSNKIMFSEIREIMKDQWLQKKLTACSAGLLKYIHGGKMGMQSKLIMLKYFNKIMKAIRSPENFTCWK